MVLNGTWNFHWDQLNLLQQCEHGNIVRQKKIINRVKTVFHGTTSEGFSSTAGSLLNAPSSSHSGIRSVTSTSIVDINLSGGFGICLRTKDRVIAPSVRYCESWTLLMLKRRTRKVLIEELLNETSVGKVRLCHTSRSLSLWIRTKFYVFLYRRRERHNRVESEQSKFAG